MPITIKPRPSNRDPGPWKELSCANGIRLVEVSSFDAFFQFVNIGFGDFDSEHLWRGQRRAEWEITSALIRKGRSDQMQLINFCRAIARCTNIEYDISDKNPNSAEDELQLWALGQHHGLATPLTDWTMYPYIALFFAFAELDEELNKDIAGFRAVFALDWFVVKEINYRITEAGKSFKTKLETPPYSAEFKKYLLGHFSYTGDWGKNVEESRIPSDLARQLCAKDSWSQKQKQLCVYRPKSNENARLNSQGGYHVYIHSKHENTSVEQWVRAHQTLCSWHNPILLTKIQIPNAERTAILQALNKMNINYLSLFPDVAGAAMHCNMALHERSWPLGFREY
jgi:hypothetical protein